MHNKVAILFGLAAMATSGSALAQEFGKQMDLVFSADRLMAFHASHLTIEDPGNPDGEYSATGFGFGWRGQATPTDFDVPRLAFDIFVIDSLSVGGALGYVNYSRSIDNNGGIGSSDQDYEGFIFSPRVGYVWMFTKGVGFWLRGGLTYHSAAVGNDNVNGFAFTIEPSFVFSPIEHFAFLAAPYADFDFVGNSHFEAGNNSFDRDTHQRSIGVFGSLLGWF
jgi:hypothetical protein